MSERNTKRRYSGRLFFGDRVKLQELYAKWSDENKVLDCPLSVIGFLEGNGLINVEAAVKFIEERTTENE